MNLYKTYEAKAELAVRMVEDSVVLLKNEEKCLPLNEGTAAFFGRAAYRPYISGSGSGMPVGERP